MKSLYAQIIEHSQDTQLDSSLSSGLNELFTRNLVRIKDIPDLPITAEKSSWEQYSDSYKTFLEKTYLFGRHRHLRFFVQQVLENADEVQHHPELEVGSDSVTVRLYTHDINDVSQSDLDMSKFVDEIYQDIQFIQDL